MKKNKKSRRTKNQDGVDKTNKFYLKHQTKIELTKAYIGVFVLTALLILDFEYGISIWATLSMFIWLGFLTLLAGLFISIRVTKFIKKIGKRKKGKN